MATNVVWAGLSEYLAELHKLPEDCRAETSKLIEGGVNSAYVTIASVYNAHQHTGTLAKRLKITPYKGSGVQLTSGSPIAWLFDNGSKARHWASGKSTGAMWGNTAPTHIFKKTIGRLRRRLLNQYREMLLRRGASTVTGE
jgi:hypothetical protein